VWESIRLWWRKDVSSWLECKSQPELSDQIVLTQANQGAFEPCPAVWAAPIHNYTCSHVFPSGCELFTKLTKLLANLSVLDDPTETPLKELGGPDYYGRIRNEHVVEFLLAQAGIRLAATLNTILADEAESTLLSTKWIAQAEAASETWQYRYLNLY